VIFWMFLTDEIRCRTSRWETGMIGWRARGYAAATAASASIGWPSSSRS
jgi:hypothetical protein